MTIRMGKIKFKGFKMTGRERWFVMEYLARGRNATEAAKAIGVNPKWAGNQGYKYLQRLAVKNFIHNVTQQDEAKAVEVYTRLTRKLEHIMNVHAPDEVMNHKEMNAAIAIDAIKEMNKMHGFYAPEKKAGLDVKIDADMQLLEETANKYVRDY